MIHETKRGTFIDSTAPCQKECVGTDGGEAAPGKIPRGLWGSVPVTAAMATAWCEDKSVEFSMITPDVRKSMILEPGWYWTSSSCRVTAVTIVVCSSLHRELLHSMML